MRRGAASAFVAWAAVGVLCAIGVAAGLQRTAALLTDPAALDRRQLEDTARLMHLEHGTAEHARVERLLGDFSAKLSDMSAVTIAHVAPGALLLLLAPLQFSRALRARRPALHRWAGRGILVLVAVSGVSGIVVGVVRPVGGMLEATAALTFGAFFLIAAARGYAAIRRRDLARHRDWMARMFAAALAISVIRLIAAGSIAVLGPAAVTARGFGLMLWAGWIITLLANELWLRRTARQPRANPLPPFNPSNVIP